MTFDLKAFIQECDTVAAGGKAAVPALVKLLDAAVADPQSLAAGLPPVDRDEILLHESDSITIYHIRLRRGVHYPPHNHRMAVVIGVYAGSETNFFYQRTTGPEIGRAGRREFTAPVVEVLPDEAIHSVANAHAAPSCAIHLYLGRLGGTMRSLWSHRLDDESLFEERNYFAWAVPLQG